jgi:hypothetical protein
MIFATLIYGAFQVNGFWVILARCLFLIHFEFWAKLLNLIIIESMLLGNYIPRFFLIPSSRYACPKVGKLLWRVKRLLSTHKNSNHLLFMELSLHEQSQAFCNRS